MWSVLSFSFGTFTRSQLDSLAQNKAIKKSSADLIASQEPVTPMRFLVQEHYLLVEIERPDYQALMLPDRRIGQVDVRGEMKQHVASFPERPGLIRNRR